LFVKELNRLMQLSGQKLGDEIIIRR
ncbi:MAG: hypothetical protein US68_C0020G0016, partial [Candidatus Shapirobacteria bacterium GW2011_GWE1_38_10]